MFRETDNPTVLDTGQDPVLSTYGRCLEAELLAVWRRVPRFGHKCLIECASLSRKKITNLNYLPEQHREIGHEQIPVTTQEKQRK